MTRPSKHVVQDLPPDTDLSSCAQEPIHIPGAIQPHGAFVAVRADERLVTHASANLQEILGLPAQAMLGRSLDDVVGETASRLFQEIRPHGHPASRGTFSLRGPTGNLLHLQAHCSGAQFVDIEPIQPEPWQTTSVTSVQIILETFKQATKVTELCDLAVHGLRQVSGYDRVILYRFNQNGDGEVTAEARST